MLRYIDGFDTYVTADTAKRWTIDFQTAILAGAGRNGTSAMRFVHQGTWASKTFDQQPTWIIGFAWKADAFSTPLAGYQFQDAGTPQCALLINPDGTISVVRGNSTVISGATSTLSLLAGTYYFIEMKVTIADSIAANSCKVRVNGVDWVTVPAGQDLKATANASANIVRVGGTQNGPSYMDDLYICDGVNSGISGMPNNDFLGDVRVERLLPTGAGATTGWTPSSPVANYTCVDEVAPNDDTDYVFSAVPGVVDTYLMGDLSSTPLNIFGLQTSLALRKDNAGSRTAAPVVRSGGVDYPGASIAVGDTYQIKTEVREANPNGNVIWTGAAVNAIEFGAKVLT